MAYRPSGQSHTAGVQDSCHIQHKPLVLCGYERFVRPSPLCSVILCHDRHNLPIMHIIRSNPYPNGRARGHGRVGLTADDATKAREGREHVFQNDTSIHVGTYDSRELERCNSQIALDDGWVFGRTNTLSFRIPILRVKTAHSERCRARPPLHMDGAANASGGIVDRFRGGLVQPLGRPATVGAGPFE